MLLEPLAVSGREGGLEIVGHELDELFTRRAALEISEGNQRVLLHRARTKVRIVLERHFGD